MKNAFIAAAVFSLATASAIVSLSANDANAGPPHKEAHEGIYLGAYGGANWDDVFSSPFVNDNTGVVVGAVLGKHVTAVPGLRFELDASFRNNEIDIVLGPGFQAQHDTVAVMGNLAYDFQFHGKIRPYVMAGAGYAQSDITVENLALLKLENSGFAWQAGAGIRTDLDEKITLGLGYRYFDGPEIEIIGFEVSDGSNHSVMLELAFDLN